MLDMNAVFYNYVFDFKQTSLN